MTNLLLLTNDSPTRRRAYLVDVIVRVTSIWGDGVLVYATDDGHLGVRLDGETRVDEYPAEHVRRV